MSIKINEDFMSLEIYGAEITAAVCVNHLWRVTGWPGPLTRNEAITALTLAERLAPARGRRASRSAPWAGPRPGLSPGSLPGPGQDPGQAGLAAPWISLGGAFPSVLLALQAPVEILKGGRGDGPCGPGSCLPAVPRPPDVPLRKPLADAGECPHKRLPPAFVHPFIFFSRSPRRPLARSASAHGHQNHPAYAMTVSASIVAAGLMTANQGGQPSGTMSRAS